MAACVGVGVGVGGGVGAMAANYTTWYLLSKRLSKPLSRRRSDATTNHYHARARGTRGGHAQVAHE
jgi:hypothetical protein